MVWIAALLIALWGLPLLTAVALGVGCIFSDRLRSAVARIIGVDSRTANPARTRSQDGKRNRR